MKACVFDGERVCVDPDWPDPAAAPGEVRVAVRLAGVCRTDLEIIKGYMDFRGVLGHEFVGTALEGPLAGRRVVGAINCACGTCDLCRRGLPAHCRNRTVLGIASRDGAFAERLVLPTANLFPVPDGVPDERAVYAELLAAAIQVTRQVAVPPRERALVLGDGRLGQLVAQVLRAADAKVLVIGREPGKLALLRDLGIDAVTLGEAGEGGDFPFVVECTGSARGVETALEYVRPRGTVVLKSTVADTTGLNLAPLVVNEVTVVGSRCGPMDAAVEMLARGDVRVEPLTTAVYSLDEAMTALEAAGLPEAIKVLIRP